MRQFIANELGELGGTRLPPQVSLEPGEMVERIELKQGGAGGFGAPGVASQPLDTGTELEGVEVTRIANQTLFGSGKGAIIESFPQVLLRQLSVRGAAPAGRKRGEAEGLFGIGGVPRAALARPN